MNLWWAPGDEISVGREAQNDMRHTCLLMDNPARASRS
jgi:hypothetical protein